MAEKFLTTQKKKVIATASLGIAGWHALTMGANPMSLPMLPAVISNPLIGGISLLAVAGAVALITIFMIWTEY